MRNLPARPHWNIGDTVWYFPSIENIGFRAVIADEVRLLGDHTWVCRLIDLPEEYDNATGRRGKTSVAAAGCTMHVIPRAADDTRMVVTWDECHPNWKRPRQDV